MVELLYRYRRNFNCFFAADSWGVKKCGRAAFRKVGEDTEIEKAAVWGYASRLVFIAFITVSIVSSASAKAITASQN